jgi:hypothetical protein
MSEESSVGFLKRGVTLDILKSEGTQPLVSDEGSEEWDKVSGRGNGVKRAGCRVA